VYHFIHGLRFAVSSGFLRLLSITCYFPCVDLKLHGGHRIGCPPFSFGRLNCVGRSAWLAGRKTQDLGVVQRRRVIEAEYLTELRKAQMRLCGDDRSDCSSLCLYDVPSPIASEDAANRDTVGLGYLTDDCASVVSGRGKRHVGNGDVNVDR
jgi:hypothetical protein